MYCQASLPERKASFGMYLGRPSLVASISGVIRAEKLQSRWKS